MATLTRLAVGLALVLVAPPAAADDYPTRPVRIIVGFGAGSTADFAARAVGQKLALKHGQQFVVESRPGAGSNLAAEFVARAPKDGHTLLMGTVANTINATLTRLSFDFAKDLTPVALVAAVPNILVAHPSIGVRSVTEFVALARAKPGQMNFASSGVGSALHVYGELFNVAAGIKLTHVPYPGSQQSLIDILAGRISVMFQPAPTVLPHVKSGALIALAATRSGVLPDLPSMAEAGFKGFDAGIWFGLFAPAGTPREIVDKISAGVNEALKMDDVVAAFHKQGFDPLGGTPDEFASYVQSEIAQWARVAEAAGLKK